MTHMKWWLACAAVSVQLAASATADLTTTYGFRAITEIGSTDAGIAEAQLFLDVIGETLTSNSVTFRFWNNGPAASSICDVYFDDGALLGGTMYHISSSGGVAFSSPATPGELPGGKTIVPKFETTETFSADSDDPVAANGVNPGEWLKITFQLSGHSYQDVLDSLAFGLNPFSPTEEFRALRVGIHVQAFPDGGSLAAINAPPVVPVPPAMVLGTLGLGVLACMRRRLGMLRA